MARKKKTDCKISLHDAKTIKIKLPECSASLLILAFNEHCDVAFSEGT